MGDPNQAPNYDPLLDNLLRAQMRSADGTSSPSLAQLLSSLIGDAQLLVRREFDLARAEVRSEIGKVRQGAIFLAAGIALLVIGGLFLVAMVAEALVALAQIDRWIAYLIVGGLLAVGGGVVVMIGIKRLQALDPLPRETIDSLRKDVQWLKEQTPSSET